MNKQAKHQRPWEVNGIGNGDHAHLGQDEGEWGDRLRISSELQEAMRKFRRVILVEMDIVTLLAVGSAVHSLWP